jgi:hypothetical protein
MCKGELKYMKIIDFWYLTPRSTVDCNQFVSGGKGYIHYKHKCNGNRQDLQDNLLGFSFSSGRCVNTQGI